LSALLGATKGSITHADTNVNLIGPVDEILGTDYAGQPAVGKYFPTAFWTQQYSLYKHLLCTAFDKRVC
jgi:hypothetical protein